MLSVKLRLFPVCYSSTPADSFRHVNNGLIWKKKKEKCFNGTSLSWFVKFSHIFPPYTKKYVVISIL